jgi:hypothetical protein
MEGSPVLAAINAELRRLESVAGLNGRDLDDEELERLGPLILDARLDELEAGRVRVSAPTS